MTRHIIPVDAINFETICNFITTDKDVSHKCASPPFLLVGGEVVEPPTKFSKRGGGGMTGSQFLERGCWRRGVTFFRGRLQFLNRKKTKI